MKIIDVIPITKDSIHESLSYFTNKEVVIGSIVMVPLRKKNVPAVVLSVKNAKKLKIEIKKSNIKIRPVKSLKSLPFLSKEFIDACVDIAKYFISPTGAVLKDLIPQTILENGSPLSSTHIFENTEKTNHSIVMVEMPTKERLQYYKSIIREEFAKNKSVFICMPTSFEIEDSVQEIKKGIENYTIALYGKKPGKKIREEWTRCLKEKHPVLILATKSFLSIPRKDISTIIFDGESSSFYSIQKRPYINIGKAVEIISKKTEKRLIIGDFFIKTETFHRYESLSRTQPSRVLSEVDSVIVDTKKKGENKWQKTKRFSSISDLLQKNIKEAWENNERMILFMNRRGYGTTTFCKDCLRTIACEKCETPLVLHKENVFSKKINFICHKCMNETSAPEQCPYCKSWQMETYGAGIQKLTEEVSDLFPKLKIFRMNGDIVKNPKQAREITNNFLSSPGSILIATEMLFYYINQPVERVAVASIDGMFTLPDFRINEKIFHLLLKLRALAKKTFLIQTRLSEQSVFNDAIRGNIPGFYRTEIENRKRFQYPPFKLLIKITREGKNKAQVKKEIEELEKNLEEWEPINYPAFIPKIKNLYSWHILLRLDPESWPDEQKKLHQILSSLPLFWKINISPESLL